ncbi:MAG: outer membrane lipoprotein carrier protein LolA [Lentimicrobiaceae bacterium]|jgi:outer membrane lipoprotein-sorting protein|nr:outer membrane lipoprotein carrier protein LolA [Lentimicrobiaceae bacterium]
MRNNKFLITICLLTIVSFCNAQPVGFKALQNASEVKASIEKTVSAVSSIESDFIQNQYMTALAEQMTMKGHFWFKKENKLRWQYTQPMQYQIIMNGSKMWMKDEQRVNEFNISSNRMFGEINDIMTSCLQGSIFKKTDKFKISFYENSKQFMVLLVPLKKDMKGFLKNIELYINKKDYSVEKLKMVEPSGDYTSIAFQNKKTNHEIPDSRFRPD